MAKSDGCKGGICCCCIKTVQWLPVIFIVCIVVWSYYAYVFALCFFTIDNVPQKVIYLIFYHGFLIVFLWSYYQTIFTPVGRVPKEFRLSPEDIEVLERDESEDRQRQILARAAHSSNLPVQLRAISGAVRYCEKCKHIKPDRAHHCSVCGTCVLKMDHHCPWVNNCVNFTNYKFFVQFLGYSLLYCLYAASTSLQFFILFWANDLKGPEKFHVLFLFFVAIMFAISLVSLFSYHLYLTAMNRSTLESFRVPMFRTGPDKDGFHLGKRENFSQVFGDNAFKWALPVFTAKGNGYTFPTRHNVQQQEQQQQQQQQSQQQSQQHNNSYNSMGRTDTATTAATDTTTPSKGNGVNFPSRAEDNDADSLLQRQRWAEDGDAANATTEMFYYGKHRPSEQLVTIDTVNT